MTQENKELLFKDLSARLPYRIKVKVIYSKDSVSSLRARLCGEGINILDTDILGLFQGSEIYIKPYLFPLSSMTEEQMKEYLSTKHKITRSSGKVMYLDSPNTISYCYKNHFDYSGLIPLELAIDATGLNIY